MLDAFSLAQLAWSAFVIFAAYVVRGTSGFGAGLVATPLLVYMLPMTVVVPVTALVVFVLFVILTIRDRDEVNWTEFKRLVAPTLVGVVAGIYLLSVLDNRKLMTGLGWFLIAYSAYMILVHWVGMAQIKVSARWAFPLGFAGAAVDTLFGGGGGTLVVIYMHGRGVSKSEFRATLAVLWFIEMMARIGGYGIGGYYTKSTLTLVALLLPFMLAGTWVGERINKRISQETFSKVLAVMLGLSGVNLLLK
jgi:hypothetical protein